VESEESAAWGKWYRGLIDSESAEQITPETAAQRFRNLPWHFYGGPYYRTSGERSFGPVHIAAPADLANIA